MSKPIFSYDESKVRKYLKDEDDVQKIRAVAQQLPIFAELVGCNLFVDCPTDDPDIAIVVAEAYPDGEEPLYREKVVGLSVIASNEPEVIRSLQTGTSNRDVLAVSHEMFLIQQISVPIWGKKRDRPIGVLIQEKRPDPQQLAQQRLDFIEEASSSYNDAVYNWIFQKYDLPGQMKEAIMLFDAQGRVTYCNQAAKYIWHERQGQTRDMIGMHFEEFPLFASYKFSELEAFCQYEAEAYGVNMEVKLIRSNKKEYNEVCALIRNVTKQRKAEQVEQLHAFLASEMNHRVKNNLQTVASLLNIQANSVQDETIRQMFYESIGRIQSIAAVHNQLSVHGGEDVELQELIGSICKSIAQLSDLEYEVTGDIVWISSPKASALGLIVNEFVQNVAKHARPEEGTRKKAYIHIFHYGDYVRVKVWDNGQGFVPGTKKNIGLTLVDRLVKEPLDGSLELKKISEKMIISLAFPK